MEGSYREYSKWNLHNFYECRYIDVLIEKMFSTLTERNNILKPRALIHTFNTCQLRIFCFTWPISTTRAKNRSLYVCYWYLLFIRIRNWNNSIWWPGTGLWCSKTEICQESNKAEIKDKFRSFKMASTKRLLPRDTDRNIKSLENLPENLNLAIDFWSRCQSITEMYEIRTNERV